MTAKTNDLIGLDLVAQNKQDEFLASLTNIAYTTTNPRSKKSKFWFRLNEDRDIKTLKRKVQTKALTHIDSEVVARLATYQEEVRPLLQANIEKVREFFLTEIAPLTMATDGGAIQSREVIQRMLDTTVDDSTYARFQNMISRAVTIKLADFVSTYFKLPPATQEMLIGAPSHDSDYKRVMEKMNQMPSKQDIEVLTQKTNSLFKGLPTKKDIHELNKKNVRTIR